VKEEIFSVFDGAANRFLQPFFAETVEVAIRMFRSVVNRPDHQFNKFPSDYTLFHIGTYDGEDGRIDSQTPRSLGLALQYVDRKAEPGALEVVS